MIKRLDLKDKDTAKKVLELQVVSYTIEAELIGFDGIPPLKDTMDSLKDCDESFYGYFIDGVLAGITSYKTIENILDIYRVAVHPHFFRRGIAQQLLSFLEKLEGTIDRIIVCTGKENIPAVRLYLKNGYEKTRDIEISKDIYLTEFEKIL